MVLKARLGIVEGSNPSAKYLGELYGIFRGTDSSSEEDIDRAQYSIDDLDWPRTEDAP